MLKIVLYVVITQMQIVCGAQHRYSVNFLKKNVSPLLRLIVNILEKKTTMSEHCLSPIKKTTVLNEKYTFKHL